MERVPPPESGPGSRGGGPESTVLVRTKLAAPSLRRQLIGRTALLEELRAADDRQLTLIDAPAGWGKTTLLAQWIMRERERNAVAWLSLDQPDNDPARFWTYVAAALQGAYPGLDTHAAGLLAFHADPRQVVLPTLLNELADVDQAIVLVLDDYHVITNAMVHEEVTFFIERMPPSLRLVIATRTRPRLPLARLRAHGQLLEIRAQDLAFHEDEARRLLNDVHGLGLARAGIELLCRRTEGWAAGLYLAALSLEGRPDAESFLQAFAGNLRHIVDYLSAEVLDGLPPALRQFLVRTSILERLKGPLCDAVLETSGSAGILDQVERENLFVAPLDASRCWYRYHQLFRELLRNELRRTEPDLIPCLHARAGAWLRAAGFTEEAVHHLVAAGDTAGSANLIAERWVPEFNRGRLSTVSTWLDLLPEETVTGDPRLCVARAWIALDMRRMPDAARWIEAAQGALADGPHDQAVDKAIESEITVLRAVAAFKVGDVAEAASLAQQAVHSDLGRAPLGRSAAYCVYAAALYWAGHTARARAAFSLAAELSVDDGNALGRTYSLGYLALLAVEQGQFGDADQLIQRAAESDRDVTSGEHFVDMLPALVMAKLLDLRGETALAADVARRAVVLSQRGGANLEVANALLARAKLLRRLGHLEAAEASMVEARALLGDCPEPGLARDLLAAAQDRPVGTEAADRQVGLAEPLTERELELLRLLDTSLSRREIGVRLFVSLNTVKTHQRALYRKLGVTDRAGAVGRARDLGLLTPRPRRGDDGASPG